MHRMLGAMTAAAALFAAVTAAVPASAAEPRARIDKVTDQDFSSQRRYVRRHGYWRAQGYAAPRYVGWGPRYYGLLGSPYPVIGYPYAYGSFYTPLVPIVPVGLGYAWW
jgi:hypothetical protein